MLRQDLKIAVHKSSNTAKTSGTDFLHNDVRLMKSYRKESLYVIAAKVGSKNN